VEKLEPPLTGSCVLILPTQVTDCISIIVMQDEAVAQLEKNNPIVESTKYFCLLTNFHEIFNSN